MPTDDERREEARRLREMGEELGSSVLLWYHIAKILGVRTATDGKTACDMLADLIDPDCGTQETASSRVPECDRDALLRLARYMDKDVAETEAHFSNVISTKSVSDYARRIREACGEVRRCGTCTVEASRYDEDVDSWVFELSCGDLFTWWDSTPPDFCPYCGCEVIRRGN